MEVVSQDVWRSESIYVTGNGIIIMLFDCHYDRELYEINVLMKRQ